MADQAKYIKIFREEAKEHLTSLSLGLLDLEQRAQDAALIHELLRNAHTLKGSAKMLGLNHIGDVAHLMEDVFNAVEEGKLSIDAALIDVLLLGTDTIRDIIDNIAMEKAHDLDISEPLSKLATLLKSGADKPDGEAAPQKSKPKAKKGKKTSPQTPKSKAARPSKKAEKEKKKTRKKTAPPVESEPEPEIPVETYETEGIHDKVSPTLVEGQSAESAPTKGERATSTGTARETIRVDTFKLDDLLNLAGELLINKIKLEGRLHRFRRMIDLLREIRASKMDGQNPAVVLEELFIDTDEIRRLLQEVYLDFDEDVIELDLLSQEIRSHAFSLRVLPASTLFDEFQRTVRDLARELKKEIKLEVTGGETELDKQLLEELRPALIHIIRNSCDHGIESPGEREENNKPRTGTIHINAYHKGYTVVIEVWDDGSGVDLERVKNAAVKRGMVSEEDTEHLSDEDTLYYILEPGFTTAPIITDLSGRGVGMDVVKTNMERIKGDIAIESSPGEFTKITLTAPLTLSIINSLLIHCNKDVFAIPLTFVEEAIRLPSEGIFTEAGMDVFKLRGNVIPLFRLDDLLGLGGKDGIDVLPEKIPVVVLKYRNQRLGLMVDQFLRDQEIVVKNMGDFLKEVRFSSGVTILRQGEPAIILNVFDIFSAAEQLPHVSIRDQLDRADVEKEVISILVVDDSITTRIMEKSILEAAGYKVELAVSGEEAQEKLKENDYHLIVTDIEMPGIDGFELTSHIRAHEKTKDIPIIIVTSMAADEHKRRGVEVGAQAYIVKSTFDQTTLLDTVQSLVG